MNIYNPINYGEYNELVGGGVNAQCSADGGCIAYNPN